jgi:K+-transporting ATPase ATPase C chain
MFPSQAKYSTMERDGKIAGYKLMDHYFTYAGYFHGSNSTNKAESLVLAPTNELDPLIAPIEAYVQIDRVAKARGLKPAQVRSIVDEQLEGSQTGLFGGTRVNVEELNLALDGVKRQYTSRITDHKGRAR